MHGVRVVMLFQDLVKVYETLEATTTRLEMTDILASFFRADRRCYSRRCTSPRAALSRLLPAEAGHGRQALLRTLAFVTGMKESAIQELRLKEGDPGTWPRRSSKGSGRPPCSPSR